MATLQEVLDKVTAQSTKLDSLEAFNEGLFDMIRDRLNLTPEQQAVLDQISAEVDSNSAKIDKAMVDNVEETPPEEPTV